MNQQMQQDIINFVLNDPSGFESAILNTADTYAEYDGKEAGSPLTWEEKKHWLTQFLVSHNNNRPKVSSVVSKLV
jgi:hypothetical protein